MTPVCEKVAQTNLSRHQSWLHFSQILEKIEEYSKMARATETRGPSTQLKTLAFLKHANIDIRN